ncbi:type II toxin-antitoxin system RelE/ParE family toxin [Lactobacillus paragasseri]|uniref:type II toxin-antitoxin system RelE/ParE family toxin n=1 Tax=Lactobacillus paragasseri TaxID=2107999 RepID=UPI00217EBACF|nr:type II toxin-antitoxin system RelE/ParE family toxin [Lactobacillus paragasseri]UWI43696.1 type II toxin-antitoxin system RelE/ParE family toxin [Lactobacillus paragasseri]UWI44939.1 type II toxin-antitoxin system RelE/ParE family toxin [Lactobacillus paragasseri]
MDTIIYSDHFTTSLTNEISYWKNTLLLSDEEITKYISLIYHNIQLLSDFPYLYQDVHQKYQMDKPTYKITIGKKYAIFYRVREKNHTIIIGSFFSNKQMRLEF